MEPRTSQYVRSKLSNLMSNGETEAGLRQYWMPDDISVECYDCTSKFTSFRRRHHCRVCGQIFCSKCCSSYIPGKQIGYSGNLRVCSFCFCYFETYLEQGAATDTQDGGDRENAPYMGRRQGLDTAVGSIPVPREYNHSSLSLNSPLVSYRGGRKASSCANVYESVGGEGLGEAEKDRHETVKLKDPAALARLWQRVLDQDEGLTMETHRYYLRSYPGTFLGNELVDWLASQDRTTSRAQAVAIGQALLKASYITSLSGQSNFTDSTEIFQPGHPSTPEEEPDSSDTPETVQGPLWLQQLNDVQSSDSSRSLEVPASTTIRVKKPLDVDRRTSSEKSATDHQKLQFDLVKGSIAEDDGVSVDGISLDAVYKKHEAWYLDNLLEGAELGKDWAGVILNLADQAVKNVSPDARNGGDEMDIRWYVKVKSVPGGSAEESILIPGEVCSLQPAHRRMADRLHQPSIALVANSIVFQREENRFVSLETVWMQEEEYIKNMCGKLMSARPNIIMVERTVARLAQDILLREGVTLVLNVKYRVLERLARLSQAKIISSVDSMLAPPKLGTCSSFFMRKFDTSPESGSLMVFEGIPPELGGTIVLRGGTKQLLSKVKMVLKRLLLVKFNWKHEKSFVLNEYGCLKDSHIEAASSSLNYRLTISPFIKVEQREDPFQITLAEDTKEVPELLNPSCDKFDVRTNETFVQEFSAEQHPWCKNFLTAHVKETVEGEKVQDMLALFRASGWRRPESRTNAPVKLMTSISFCQPKPFPLDHSETLSVLFSSYSSQSSVAPNYCIPPWVVNMELYGNLDITLGGFLEDFCFSAEYQCPNKQCSTPITEHTRRFCHAGGGVEIHMQKLEAPIMGESNKLMMWKYCTNCQLITPIVPVTNDTWSLSFALFLQLLLHDDHLVRRGYNRPDAVCCHSLHQEHLTCFGKMDAVATFKYTKLQVWRVAAPPYNPEMPGPPCGQEDLLSKLRTLKKHGGGVYSAVLELLLASKGDNAEGVATLMPEQEAEFLSYTERVKALEEEVMSSGEHETATLDKLHLLARDIVLAYQVWNGKLEKMQEIAKKVHEKAKKNSSLHRSSSTEVLDSNITVTITKKPEPDTTVKKLISAILPPVEEALLPNPFPLDMHIITSVDGHKLDDPLSLFVTETQPSTIIAYLLSCGAYKDFLATDRVDDQGVKVKGVNGEREESPGSDLEGIHCELQFSDATTKFYCCSYFPHWFDKLRGNIFPGKEEDLIYSLSGCSRWEAMGGKSGLSFFKTDDDRFILKQMSRFEFQSFLEFAPHYFEYITQCINSKVKTLLGKIIGVYKLGFKNSSTGAGLKMDVLIMENLFYNRDITKSYDLKGAIRNRLTVTEGKNDLGLVLLDENLVRVSCESPLYINSQDRQSLVEAIKRDAAFLASHNMMDYSLLAGISKSSGELVLGIIDYIRTFTWDKKLETLMKSVKSSGFLGGQAKTPTVIHPDLYKLRFTEAMSRYFLLVPDWSDAGACNDLATWS